MKFKLQRSDAAYLAGLIDGEGHVSGTQPMLQITTTTPEITDWLLATVPVGRLQKNRLTSTGKTIYRWYLSTQFGCDRLYRQVLPHIKIIEKRERMAKFTGLSYS